LRIRRVVDQVLALYAWIRGALGSIVYKYLSNYKAERSISLTLTHKSSQPKFICSWNGDTEIVGLKAPLLLVVKQSLK